MARETSKSKSLREIHGDFEKYLRGPGIDIGGGPDPLDTHYGIVDVWDMKDGDAMLMNNVPDCKYNFVYSSHCLEHTKNIETTIKNWARILKPGGYLYITVPDYELYEKNKWPSTFAYHPEYGHFHSFSIEIELDRDTHFNIDKDFKPILEKNNIKIIEIRKETDGYDYTISDTIDQTGIGALIQICIICKKLKE